MTNESFVAVNLFESIQLFEISDYNYNDFKVEGKNAGRILILSLASTLHEDERAMLGKMLNALKLNWEDVALLCSTEPPPFHSLKNRIAFKKMIAFDIDPLSLCLNVHTENYSVINFSDTKILFGENLSMLLKNEKSKSQLWKALKEMFGMN